jgi:hypothetical protein
MEQPRVLVRDFVFHSLYGPGVGYFQQGDVVGSVWDRSRLSNLVSEDRNESSSTSLRSCPPNSEEGVEETEVGLDFNTMLGEMEYRHIVAQLYDQGGSAWMTPCELFHPWYAPRSVGSSLQKFAANVMTHAPPANLSTRQVCSCSGTIRREAAPC